MVPYLRAGDYEEQLHLGLMRQWEKLYLKAEMVALQGELSNRICSHMMWWGWDREEALR